MDKSERAFRTDKLIDLICEEKERKLKNCIDHIMWIFFISSTRVKTLLNQAIVSRRGLSIRLLIYKK